MSTLASPVRTASLLGMCLLALLLGACGDADSEPAATLKLGALVSLTGVAAPIGAEQARAMRLAVNQVNADGGIDGTRLELVLLDTGADPARGAEEMRRLIVDDEVAAVLGPTLSRVAVRADPIAVRLRTPVVAVSNTVTGIVGSCASDCEWIWRDSLGAEQTVSANVAYAVEQGRPRSAALLRAAPDVLAASETRVAAAAFRRRDVPIVGDVALPQQASDPAAPQAIRVAVGRALAARPDALFVSASDGALLAQAIQAARAQGFAGQLLGGDVLNETGATGAAREAGPGVRSGAAWFAGNDFPANVGFVRAYRATYRQEPGQFAAQAYAGVRIVAQAIERGEANDAGRTLQQRRAAIQDGLGKVALTTPLGPFRFTREHDVEQIVWILETDGRGDHDLVQFCDPGC